MEPGDTDARVAGLRRRLDRERAVRREAEEISERITRELYDKQQGLMLLERVAKSANEAGDVASAVGSVLDAIVSYSSWSIGHAWLLSEDDVLESTGLWAGDVERFAAFKAASDGLRFGAGQGLPGRVLKERTALWLTDDLSTLPRGAALARTGLCTGMCLPIFAGQDVVGVLEFFDNKVVEPDADLIALMGQIGTQLGRVVERQRAADELVRQATHDALTGLPNRALILDHLTAALARQMRRDGEQIAVLFLDLDGFKSINDTVGHAAGDRMLRKVAERLSTFIRPHDVLGRLSGDEFVVICEGLTQEHPAAMIAERLAAALRAPLELDGEQLLVTASIGISLAEGSEDPTTLIAQADAAMYRSKELGRARIEVFSDALRVRITKRLDLERSMRRAVEREELRLHYQPEVDLRTGAVVGLEALLRWERGAGTVMPGDFIPLAEETGLIVPLGAWALDAAVRQAHDWIADLDVCAEPWMSVNLSVRQLSHPSLVRDVAAVLARHSFTAKKLYLEVTESLVVDDAAAGLAVLTDLRSLGTEIAIDDFGTGYASLSYLRQFPASVLKIDRSFIATIAEEPRTRAIVSAIVDMAHALGLQVVAEGVETAEQLAVVRALGCDIGQGYYFARPAPAAEMRRLLIRPFAFAELVGLGGGEIPQRPLHPA